VVDADGPALAHALDARPDVIKPNAEELRSAAGRDDPEEAARALHERGASAVVASLGPLGLLAVGDKGNWRAEPPERITGNPTGAGDAVVAAIAAGLAAGDGWPEILREAVALSAATVLHPQAGGFDLAARERFRRTARVYPASRSR
jgi:tagatose 6-phosphate kinase